MKKLLALIFVIPLLVKSQSSRTNVDIEQTTTGVRWVQGLTWKQIKAKAQAEKKYIFIDAFATWCGPCKMMEKEVFVNDSVGEVVNENFIAVRVQIDTSKNDDDRVKSWYADAANLNRLYKIKEFPTFLFMSPEGKIVHRGRGYNSPKDFIELLKDALNPSKQFYTLVGNYEGGKKDYPNMKVLSGSALYFGRPDLAKRIALDYINNYLLEQKDKEIYTRDNLAFITSFVDTPSQKAFQIIYKDPKRINKLLDQPGYAEVWIHYIISRTELDSAIVRAKKIGIDAPNWKELSSTIKRKYNSYYADRTIIDAKSRWYGLKKNWPEFTKYTVQFVENYGAEMGDFDLALKSWSVFDYSADEKELKAALRWSKQILNRSKDSINMIPAVMDTYANLLYKLNYLFGDKKPVPEAIAIEQNALELATKNKIENYQKSFAETIKKMKNSEPTWKSN